MLGGLADVLDDLADGRANNHQFGIGHALVQVDRRMGDGADAASHPQTGLAAADADNAFRQVALAQSHADRPADQADTHNGDGVPGSHGMFRVGVGRNRGRAAKTAYCSRSLREGRGDRGERQEASKVALERTEVERNHSVCLKRARKRNKFRSTRWSQSREFGGGEIALPWRTAYTGVTARISRTPMGIARCPAFLTKRGKGAPVCHCSERAVLGVSWPDGTASSSGTPW